jgi:hypothetical protein
MSHLPYHLDKEEAAILEAVERGEYEAVPDKCEGVQCNRRYSHGLVYYSLKNTW